MKTENISINTLRSIATEVYEDVKQVKDGLNANYIPYLDNIDSELYGISIVTKKGEIITLGDHNYAFGVESVSKVFTAILAMKQSGVDKILSDIGADATGLPFNSIMAILLENNHPSTPLVNAGAISAVSMINPKGDSIAKWNAILNNFTDLCGSDVTLIDELYKSESDTNFNNRAIASLLDNYKRIYDDSTISLDLYTRQCSLGITTEQLSIAAATIAFGGVNPITNKEAFPAEIATKITSLIATVGFYEHTGNWMFQSGVPAKSGVGGGIMGIIPGVMGIAAFSPRLDEAGNSVRAQESIKRIANKLNINIYGTTKIHIE